jgi:hypothetical protein
MSTPEAARRLRRPRAVFAAIAAVAAVALAGSAIAIFGGQPGAPAATIASRPGVVAVWARIHEGWIFVYDDGRVFSHPDLGPVFERRLSAHGVDLVRRGIVAPQDLQLYLSMTVPAEAWSDPIPAAYRPDRYAVCKVDVDGTPDDEVLGDVGSIWRRLPAQMQTLLRAGRVLSFTVDSLDENRAFIGQDGHHIERGPGAACFVLSRGQARAVWAQTRAPGDSREEAGELMADTTIAEPTGVADADFRFLAVPLLPHGGWIFWGG